MPDAQRWLPNIVYVIEVRHTDKEDGGVWAPGNAPVFPVRGLAERFLVGAPVPVEANLATRIRMYRRVGTGAEDAVIAMETAEEDEKIDPRAPVTAIHVANDGEVRGVQTIPTVEN